MRKTAYFGLKLRRYFAILNSKNLQAMGLQPNKEYSEEELKKQFISLAKQHHPDVSKASNAKEKFMQISEAYRALLDEIQNPEKEKTFSSKGRQTSTKETRRNEYGMSDQEYAEFLAYRKSVEQQQKDDQDPRLILRNARFRTALIILVVSNIIIYLHMQNNIAKAEANMRRLIPVKNRRKRLTGVPELTVEECRKHTPEELFEMESLSIAKMPDEVFNELVQRFKR